MVGTRKGNGRESLHLNIDRLVVSQIREKYPGQMSDIVNKCVFEYFRLMNGDTLISCPCCSAKFAWRASSPPSGSPPGGQGVSPPSTEG